MESRIPHTNTSFPELRGRTAVVTGGTRGIGRAIASGLASQGMHVTLIGRDQGVAQAVARDLSHRGSVIKGVGLDVGDIDRVESRVESLCENQEVYLLVNSAGVIHRQSAVDHALADWSATLNTNLTGLFLVTKAIAKGMVARRNGRIVNIASVLAYSAGRNVAAYAASKSAVVQLTRTLAVEWAPFGVNVNAITAGYFRTDMTKPLQEDISRENEILARVPVGRWGNTEELVGPVLFLASQMSTFVTGATLAVDGGWLAN